MSTHEQRMAWEEQAEIHRVPVPIQERVLKALSLGMVVVTRVLPGGTNQHRLGWPQIDETGDIETLIEDETTNAYNRVGDQQYGITLAPAIKSNLLTIARDTQWLNARGRQAGETADWGPIDNLARKVAPDALNRLPLLDGTVPDSRHLPPGASHVRLAAIKPGRASYEALRALVLGMLLVDLTTISETSGRPVHNRHLVPMEIIDDKIEITTRSDRFLGHANRKNGFVMAILADIAPFIVNADFDVTDGLGMIGEVYVIDQALKYAIATHIHEGDMLSGAMPDRELAQLVPPFFTKIISTPTRIARVDVEQIPVTHATTEPDAFEAAPSEAAPPGAVHVELAKEESAAVAEEALSVDKPAQINEDHAISVEPITNERPVEDHRSTRQRTRDTAIIAMLKGEPFEQEGEAPTFSEIARAIVQEIAEGASPAISRYMIELALTQARATQVKIPRRGFWERMIGDRHA